MTLKEITDAEKPWFDYVAYLLRITAWFLAIAYASNQLLRPAPPNTSPNIFAWFGISLAFLFGIFLIFRFIKMSMSMAREIAPDSKDHETRSWLLRCLLTGWLIFGMPSFVVNFTLEVVELYLEKIK